MLAVVVQLDPEGFSFCDGNVAQVAEQSALNRIVAGSTPVIPIESGWLA